MADVKIYTKKICPFCIKAKMILKGMGAEFEEIEVDDKKIQELAQKTNMMTVPQIFINDELVGGCSELVDLKESGKLKEMLA